MASIGCPRIMVHSESSLAASCSAGWAARIGFGMRNRTCRAIFFDDTSYVGRIASAIAMGIGNCPFARDGELKYGELD